MLFKLIVIPFRTNENLVGPLQISGPNMAARDGVIRDSAISARGTGGSVSKRDTVAEDTGRRTYYGT